MISKSERVAVIWRRDWQVPRFIVVRIAVITGLLAVPAVSFADTASHAVDQCISKILHSQKTRNEKKKIELDFYCPRLPQIIRRSPLSRNLSYDFDSISSVAELRDLRQFLAHSRRPTANAFSFRYGDVDGIVKGILQVKPEPQPGLWDRFWDWLKQYLPKLDKEDSEKLDKFIRSISFSEQTGKILFYGSSAIILAIAFWIVFREWRYYRRVGGTRKLQQRGGVAMESVIDFRAVSLADLPNLPNQYKIPALLHWVINYCVGQGELPPNQSLTNREMLRILKQQKSTHSRYFSELVGESERVVYGNAVPAEDRVAQLLAGAQALETDPEGQVA